MQQSLFFKNSYSGKKAHGGNITLGRRKSKRPLSAKNPFHVTLRSDFATGKRSLLRHKNLINRILNKASRRFIVKIYQQAICGNHIHLLVHGRDREALQNFFRVVAGHIAQQILEQYPIPESERKAMKKAKGLKWGNAPSKAHAALTYERKFWDALLFSRFVRWGKDFVNVVNYIERNVLEAIGWIPYKPRGRYVQARHRSTEWGNALVRGGNKTRDG